MENKIIHQIKQKKLSIAVIGLGYVGLPLCMRFIQAGLKVYGIDVDKKKIELLRKGKSYINDLKINKLNYFKKNKNNLSHKFDIIKNAEIIIVALPTPLKKNFKPEMKYLNNCISILKEYDLFRKIIILESTVYPGATEKYFKNLLTNKDLKTGKDIFLGYSPERENPGDNLFTYKKTPKVISGKTLACKKVIKAIYAHIVKKIHVAESIKIAELSKLLENTYRSINIGFINEFKIMADKINLNVWDVIKAAKTKNFGFVTYFPGPGIGGHCIPIDPFYLDWAIKKKNYNSKFINASKRINKEVLDWTIYKIKKLFKNKEVLKTDLLFLGITYKKNTNDIRESPSLKLFYKLYDINPKIKFHDPYIDKIEIIKNKKKFYIKSLKKFQKNLSKSTVIIGTNHDIYNYKKILKNSKFIIDTRGAYINNSEKKLFKF